MRVAVPVLWAGRRRLWAAACCRAGSMCVSVEGVRQAAATCAAWVKIETRTSVCMCAGVEHGVRVALVIVAAGTCKVLC